jgi:hypothetical protein
MPGTDLTQDEADALIDMEKRRVSADWHGYPEPGVHLSIPLESVDGREHFLLDILQGRIKLSKATYQNRGRSVVVLLRLDIDGPPHRNPEGEEVPCPHIHIYKQGYGDKWAYPLPAGKFSDLNDLFVVLQDFMAYCNVTDPPLINRGLQT